MAAPHRYLYKQKNNTTYMPLVCEECGGIYFHDYSDRSLSLICNHCRRTFAPWDGSELVEINNYGQNRSENTATRGKR